MRLPAVLSLLATVAASTTLASARPMTAGVSLGLAQDEVTASQEPNQTLGLFGRLSLTRRVSGQVELVQHESTYNAARVRTGTALLVADLAPNGQLVPVLLAGLGIDRATTSQDTTSGRHLEGGVGLEYRAAGGLTLGADVRVGLRAVEQKDVILAAETAICDATAPECGGGTFLLAPTLQAGEYRVVRVTLGVRF